MAFCGKCGNQIPDGVKFCNKCGASTSPGAAPNPNAAPNPGAAYTGNAPAAEDLLTKLSERVKISAVIWLVIGILQILSGVFILVGAWNIYVAIKNMQYSKNILTNPVGIVAGQESMTFHIIGLVINLVFGAIIGVGGSLYDLFCVRALVMDNKNAFLELEQRHLSGRR